MTYPFLENKYTKVYWQIIERAKDRQLIDYAEKHHIIPKSLGGPNLKENIVKLTAREHFICHLLLRKMVVGTAKRSMTYAVNALVCCRRNKHLVVTSRVFERLKKEHSDIRTGVKRPTEVCQKISQSKMGVSLNKSHRINIGHGIKKWFNENEVKESTKEKLRLINLNKKFSTETKAKIGAASKGRHQTGRFIWSLSDPTGRLYENIISLADFCSIRGLHDKPLRSSPIGRVVIKGSAKGWSVVSREIRQGRTR